ncbi:MAG: hypothetical protein J6S85_07145 [Methanobrevibacter sp.]|nr:hypothetical protein [Methanobrevibacter sp.]
MYQRIARKKYIIKALDIETHNDTESLAKGETSMWLGCYIDENSKVEEETSYFYSMNELIDILERDTNPKRSKNKNESRPVKNIAIYIYNLSFEFSFLLPALFERGFTFKEHIEKEDEYVFNSVSTKSVSSVWQVSIKFKRSGGMVLLRDLSKMYGGGLGKVAKAFGLETQKGEIDYRKNRLHDYVITKEEKEYCFNDTRILMEILMKMDEKNDKDFWNAVSMASYSMRKLLKRGWPRKLKPYKEFRTLYPELDEKETEFLRHSVGGGITYAPSRFQFKELNVPVAHIDLHQAHPSSAFLNQFPYDRGEYFVGKPLMGRICCCHIRISYDYVRLHSIIKLIGLPFVEDRELWVWDFEIPVMEECYENLTIEYIDGYAYKMRPLKWKRYYADNYNYRLEAKERGDAFNTLYYKLLNNSSYGKLLEKPHNYIFANTIRDDGIIDSLIEEKEEKEINARYTYLPVGSCIPAYTRCVLIRGALKLGYENIVYFDTDSIFFIWNEKTKKIWEEEFDHNDWLGGWGEEDPFILDRSQFTAPKRYKFEGKGKTTIKAGGINFDEYIKRVHKAEFDAIYDPSEMTEKEAISKIEIPFDEINITNNAFKVQRAFRCKGGTLIDFQDKEMKIQEKYIGIYEKNKVE